MGILALFFSYAGMYWRYWEKIIAIVTKAEFKQATNHSHRSYPKKTLKGERRCYRGPVPRGRPKKPGENFRYINKQYKLCRAE
jgi:hypothetical protein